MATSSATCLKKPVVPPIAIDPGEREKLILEHLPQVRQLARRIHERLPISVSLEDLVSTGTVGLISAIDHFDATQNVKLKTYAEYRIRGAMLDSLRRLDRIPRQQRRRSRQIETAIESAEKRFHCSPTEEQIAAELNISVDEYRVWAVETSQVNLCSLEQAQFDDSERGLLHCISDKQENWPSHLFETTELEALLDNAVSKIPEIERTVLHLYYKEDMTLREIGRIVNFHESRISQLKLQALGRLRTYMETRWPMEKAARSSSEPREEALSC